MLIMVKHSWNAGVGWGAIPLSDLLVCLVGMTPQREVRVLVPQQVKGIRAKLWGQAAVAPSGDTPNSMVTMRAQLSLTLALGSSPVFKR